MSGGAGWSKLLFPLPILIAALGALYSNPYPVLNRFAGRMHDAQIFTDHLHHGPLNNDKCWKNTAGQACEDIRIHHPSGVAFLACGYPETRNVFYPPINRHNTTAAATYHEYFLKYDITTNTTTRLKLDGLDASHDLILHGIDLFVPTDDTSKIYLFAVNHPRKGEEILLFSHVLGSDVLTFVRAFSHPLIKTPNAVAAASLSSFFISNDHYFYGGGLVGHTLRTLEGHFGPWRWATDIVYCTASDSGVDCKSVSPPNSQPSANGVLLVDEGKTLLVNDVVEATTTVYDVDTATGALSVRKKVRLGAGADNLSEIPGSGDLVVCVFPDMHNLVGKLTGDNMINSSYISEAGLVRLVKAKDYEPQLLFWDDGSLITLLTGAAADPVRGKIVAGGVAEKHFVVCDVQV